MTGASPTASSPSSGCRCGPCARQHRRCHTWPHSFAMPLAERRPGSRRRTGIGGRFGAGRTAHPRARRHRRRSAAARPRADRRHRRDRRGQDDGGDRPAAAIRRSGRLGARPGRGRAGQHRRPDRCDGPRRRSPIGWSRPAATSTTAPGWCCGERSAPPVAREPSSAVPRCRCLYWPSWPSDCSPSTDRLTRRGWSERASNGRHWTASPASSCPATAALTTGGAPAHASCTSEPCEPASCAAKPTCWHTASPRSRRRTRDPVRTPS